MVTDLLTLKEKIKTEALGLGFNHFGVAQAIPSWRYQNYLDWIDQGYQGEMAYLSRPDAVAKRGDPEKILEGCQRIISLALPYRPPEDQPVPAGFGRISAYARTVDYHLPIWDKLGQLETYIRQEAGVSTALRSYVDTGPVLERGFAAAAGLGQTGKNACLIIQGTGSYFFLAEILTDLPLPVDPPYTRDLCGSCQRCIDACPTQCILPNRSLDARRCISYLTIEHKGTIPDDLKSQMGDWVFGCDICQMVCPHNAWTPEQNYPLGQNSLPAQMDLIELFALDQAAFKQRFKDTPMERTKRKGLLRNAAIALGNQRAQASLPTLWQALDTETDEGILDACRWAIRQIENISGMTTQKKTSS